MVQKLHHQTLVQRLKRKVHLLQKREVKSRTKLSAALKKIRQLEHSYQHKLVSKTTTLNTRLVNAQSAAFIKLAAKLQRQLLQDAEVKRKRLQIAMDKLGKKLLDNLTTAASSKKKRIVKLRHKKK